MARKPHWELGARIHAARVRRGFKFTQLAAYVGVTEIAVRAWEAGASRPTRERLVKIAEGLGVPEKLLLDGGIEWDEHLVGLQPLPGPDVFQWPTLFPAEMRSDDDEGGVDPFRVAPGIDPAETMTPVATEVENPAAKPRRGKPPTKAELDRRARAARRERFKEVKRSVKEAARMAGAPRRRKADFLPLIEAGACCGLCLNIVPTHRRGGGRYCRACLDMFDDAK